MLGLADRLQSWPDADGAFLGLQNRLNRSASVLLGVRPPLLGLYTADKAGPACRPPGEVPWAVLAPSPGSRGICCPGRELPTHLLEETDDSASQDDANRMGHQRNGPF